MFLSKYRGKINEIYEAYDAIVSSPDYAPFANTQEFKDACGPEPHTLILLCPIPLGNFSISLSLKEAFRAIIKKQKFDNRGRLPEKLLLRRDKDGKRFHVERLDDEYFARYLKKDDHEGNLKFLEEVLATVKSYEFGPTKL